MKAFVGTSGWFYDWNEDRTLDWYVARSGLNAVELNASFYRFPFPNMVKAWAGKGKDLAWSIKVNRMVTHTHRFNPAARKAWMRFRELFRPLDPLVRFYLFQLHPGIRSDRARSIETFARETGLGERFALEPRHESWFNAETRSWAQGLSVTLVSVDAPEFGRDVVNTAGLVYVRMHGRTGWYDHDYKAAELRGVAAKIGAARPKAGYVFFNNDEHMLANARSMLRLLAGRARARTEARTPMSGGDSRSRIGGP
jgi:uncharacterized protein YecE (DUF72 family)